MDKSIAFRKKIVKELFFRDELSAAELSEITNKSLPIIGKFLNELIQDNWIVESGYAVSTGGRRPQVFSLHPDSFYIIAVAVDQHIARAAIINAGKKITGQVENIRLDLKNTDSTLETLVDFINTFIQKSGLPLQKIAGIGIGMPGFVDANKGVNHTYFTNAPLPLRQYLCSKTGLPVFIDNDSSIMGLAELRMGAARNCQNAMVINIGWGIGLGMIIDKKLFRGDNGFAGEFSHIPLFLSNKICDCGKAGCLEVEASLNVVAEKALKGVSEGKATILRDVSLENIEKTINDILAAAIKGDKFCIELLSETGFNIGRGVAILIHLTNPGLIILTGRGAKAGKLWLAPLQQALNMYCIPRLAENTVVEISSLGYEAGLMGAAALVMENLNKDFIQKKDKSEAELYTVQKN